MAIDDCSSILILTICEISIYTYILYNKVMNATNTIKKSWSIIRDENQLLWQLVFNGNVISQHRTYLNAKQQLVKSLQGKFLNRDLFGEYEPYFYNWIQGSTKKGYLL